MIRTISAHELKELSLTHALIDVRSPAEFVQGHIPSAHNVPLFSNEQRALVGTLYVQEGREQAISAGLEIVGGHLAELVAAIKKVTPNKKAVVYCWRGGMRSKSVVSLMNSLGYDVAQLTGGYKAFRTYNRELFARKSLYGIISGQTGSGKTAVLKELAKLKEQVIDLEGLACHKGSVFGAFGQKSQPTQEQFENLLAWQLAHIDPTRIVWLEDESRTIGRCAIPEKLWEQMRTAPRIILDVPKELRTQHLIDEYGTMPAEYVHQALTSLEKHLGSERARMLRTHLDQPEFILEHLLDYYDKTYAFSAQRRKQNNPEARSIIITQEKGMDRATLAQMIIEKTLKILSA